MTKVKKLLILMLICVSAVTAASLSVRVKTGRDKTYAAIGGSGTANDPYTISSEADLKQFAGYINAGAAPWRNPGKYYKLTADIALSGIWTPVGTSVWWFAGIFNGNGHKITGLRTDGGSYQGLFGYIEGGTVSSLGVECASVNGTANIGGIAGNIKGGAITNCYFDGSVGGTGSVIGGIAGSVDIGTVISGCYVTGSVSGSVAVGGIAGYAYGSTVMNCYTKCAVSSTGTDVGGIVGIAFNTAVENCYATGAVGGANDAGGLAGSVFYDAASIKNSVALNPSVAADDRVGRVAGNTAGGPVLGGNYGLIDVMNKNGNTAWGDKGLDNSDGQDIGLEDVMLASFWINTVNWPEDIWLVEDGKLPVLKNTGGWQILEAAFAVTITHSDDGKSAAILITAKPGRTDK